MALKSRAEVQLLQVLNQNKAKSVSGYLKEQQQRAHENGDNNGDDDDEYDDDKATGQQHKQQSKSHKLKQGDLAQFRKENRKDARPVREEDELVAQVRQLQDNFYIVRTSDNNNNDDASSCANGPKSHIEVNAIARRDKHMAAQHEYTEQVKHISEDIESAIIKCADAVKDALAQFDSRLKATSNSLADDVLLLKASNDDVLRMWEREMEAICTQRTRQIAAFAQELDDIELTRTKRVRKGLMKLTEVLMDTAHALPPEVERIIESEAYELNVVVTSNRKVYADLVARMATADVDVFVNARLAWEKGQRHWRQLRHKDAIYRFQGILNSTLFTDPDERRKILKEIWMHQESIHNGKRLAYLKQLEDAKAELSSEKAKAILHSISTTQVEEEAKNHQFFEQLMSVHVDKTSEAQHLREALRLEIHGFGAMAKEGEIELCQSKLATLLNDPSLEEFFRMTGGLRGELDSVVKRLDISELIYLCNLQPLTTSLQVLLSALPLEEVMETQGKGAERKALQATLEKIRKAGKHEILPLLPSLQTQMVGLSNLNDMSEEFKNELEEIAFQLDQLVQEYGLAAAASTDSEDSSTSPSDSGAVAPTNVSAGAVSGKALPSRSSASRSGLVTTASSAGPTPTMETSLSSTSSSSSNSPPKSKTSEFSQTAAYNFIDLQAIRKVQRRLSTLLYASELNQPIQQHLSLIAEQLILQANANKVVDQVITAECEELLDSRHQESKIFLEAMGREMEQQSALLHNQTEKLAKFCLNVALCMEQSVDKVRYIDLSVMDLLDALKDDDEEKLAAFEAQYLQSCARLRHAPNDAVLQDEFQVSSTLLQQIEAEYRMYHRKNGLATDHHVIAIEKQRQMFLGKLCKYFRLSVTSTDANQEALDVDKFLSAKYIEDIVNPPPPASEIEEEGERVENPQEGGVAATATITAGGGSGVTPRSEPVPAHPERPQKTGKQTDASPRVPPKTVIADAKQPFRASSGFEAGVVSAVPELLSKILAHVDADESAEPESSAPDAELPTEPPVVPPQPSISAGEPEAGSVDEETLALAARQQLQQNQVMEKVTVEFLRLEIPVSVMEHMLTTMRDAFVSRYDCDGKKTTNVTAETREQRVADSNFLLEDRLRMHWPRSGRLGVQIYQPRMGELMSHRQRQERQFRSVLKKADAQETTFASQVKLAIDHIEQVRVKQISCQAQLPMQTSLAALQGLEGKSKKLLKAFKVEGCEKANVLRAMIEADLSSLISSLQDFLRACTSQLFPDLISCDVISGCDYHPDEISGLKEKMVAFEGQLRERISEREQKIKEIVEAQNQVVQLAQSFKARYQACMQNLSMKDGFGQKYGLPRRTAQERYRSEVTRCDERSAKIDELLASLNAMVETNEPKKSNDNLKTRSSLDDRKNYLSSAILRKLLQLRAKMYNRGRCFGLLKNLSQLELTPVEFDPSGGGGADGSGDSVLRDRDVVDEQDMSPSSSLSSNALFLNFVQEVSAKCREDTRQIYQQEGKLEELPNGSVPPSLEEYLHGLSEKARVYVVHQEIKYREQVHFFGELLALAPESALGDFLKRSKELLGCSNERLSNELEAEFAAFMEQKNRHSVELRPELCSPNNKLQLQALSDREVSRSQQTVARLQHFRAQVMITQAQASFAFEKELVAMFRCFMTILDTCVTTLDDLKPFSGEELPKLKRKSLKRLRKVARIQEFGDVCEVKRTDAELQKLTQLGEVPRFPKRSWPSIKAFGAHAIWEAQQVQILNHDGQHQLPTDEAIKALDCSKFATADDGACVALLTHAHRSLVSARDTAYAAYMAFCDAQNKQLVDTIQEKLRDELKWVQSWQQGIATMHD